jgi:glucoamylase
MDLLQVPFLASISNSTVLGITSLAQPIMYSFTSVLAVAFLSLHSVFAHPDPSRTRREGDIFKRDVDSFIATESPIALRDMLCNIGSTGACVSGAASGLVIAGPGKANPDCRRRLRRTFPPLSL